MTTALDRFLRYVVVDTRADDSSTTCPSSAGQLELARLLTSELEALGLADASVDENGYVMATVPATPGFEDRPAIGFVAHLDTSPEMSGTDVRPIVHRAYDGGDIVLPDDPSAIIRAAENPDLTARAGDDIVTASGLTLLGADDKAGIAAIMTAVEHLLTDTRTAHGPVRVCFTPDEEIGRGADRFDVARFNCLCAYTLDGGSRGELEYEKFFRRPPDRHLRGLQHASRLRERADGECHPCGCRLRRLAAPPGALAGNDGGVRGFHARV